MEHPVTLLALSQKSTRPDITRAWCEKTPAGVYLWAQIGLGLVLLLLRGWGHILHIFRGSKSILYDNRTQYETMARHSNEEQAFIIHTCAADSNKCTSVQYLLLITSQVGAILTGPSYYQVLS